MPDIRTEVLITMARLIEKQGYHATGINEIIRASGAPKGSLYYYFPEGKEQIGAEAILEAGKIISGRLRNLLAAEPDPGQAIYAFLLRMADDVEKNEFGAASPLTTAAVETAVTSERINLACREAFNLIIDVFKDKFIEGDVPPAEAEEFALYITTVVEGGILMSRVYHQAQPLRQAAHYLQKCFSR